MHMFQIHTKFQSVLSLNNKKQLVLEPASGVTVCYPQYCDSNPSVQQHNSDGSSTGASCADWGQCEGGYIWMFLVRAVGLGLVDIGVARHQQQPSK